MKRFMAAILILLVAVTSVTVLSGCKNDEEPGEGIDYYAGFYGKRYAIQRWEYRFGDAYATSPTGEPFNTDVLENQAAGIKEWVDTALAYLGDSLHLNATTLSYSAEAKSTGYEKPERHQPFTKAAGHIYNLSIALPEPYNAITWADLSCLYDRSSSVVYAYDIKLYCSYRFDEEGDRWHAIEIYYQNTIYDYGI